LKSPVTVRTIDELSARPWAISIARAFATEEFTSQWIDLKLLSFKTRVCAAHVKYRVGQGLIFLISFAVSFEIEEGLTLIIDALTVVYFQIAVIPARIISQICYFWFMDSV
jgi:hypothetical protein